MPHILLADREKKLREELRALLEKEGLKVEECENSSECFQALSKTAFEVILLDSHILREAEKIDLVTYISRNQPLSKVIVLTALNHIESAVEAMRKGAYLYLVKPVQAKDVLFLAKRALKLVQESLSYKRFEKNFFECMVGDSLSMKKVLYMASKVAKTDSTVLLLGESGTGKEVVAEFIHQMSPRAHNPFVAVNCAALPETLLESELFGHVKGAFTGAASEKRGLFQEASEGTIFLDEVGEIPLSTQVKLLRFLQNKEIRRLGENKTIKVNVRIITASNKDLVKAIQEKTFREDLYYRINVIQIYLPPLRERMESLRSLINFFIDNLNKKFQKNIKTVDEDAMFLLSTYNYPGNVRELENIIEHAVVISDDNIISASDLPESIRKPSLLALPKVSQRSLEGKEDGDTFVTLAEMEKILLAQTLRKCRGNMTVASKKLSISRSTLWRKINKYGLQAF